MRLPPPSPTGETMEAANMLAVRYHGNKNNPASSYYRADHTLRLLRSQWAAWWLRCADSTDTTAKVLWRASEQFFWHLALRAVRVRGKWQVSIRGGTLSPHGTNRALDLMGQTLYKEAGDATYNGTEDPAMTNYIGVADKHAKKVVAKRIAAIALMIMKTGAKYDDLHEEGRRKLDTVKS